MRIICLEEHTSDAALAEACAPTMSREAPYAAAIGSAHQDDPAAAVGRPGLQAPGASLADVARPIHERLPAMDAAGIDMQVLSHSNLTQWAPRAEAAALARAANDRLAETVARHPGRFAGFSTLPWQDPDAAAREVERSARELGLGATMLSGHPAGDALIDDPRYEPVLAALERHEVPLYIHPGPPLPTVQRPYYGGFSPEVTGRLSLFGWGWHNEAGVQVVRLILSGALERHRGLKLISGHWGEMVPFFLQRIDDTLPTAVTGLSRTVSRIYRDQVWVTPSGMLSLPHFLFIRAVLGAERIMFAVDYPYLTMTGARSWLEGLPVPEAERHAIAHGNAEALLRIVQA